MNQMNNDLRTIKNTGDYSNWKMKEVKVGILIVLTITFINLSINFKIDSLLLMFIFDFILIAIIFIFLLRRKKNWLQLLGLIKFKKEFLVEGAGLLLLCYFIIFLFTIFLKLLKIEIPSIDLKNFFDVGPSIWFIILDFSIKGPFIEEVFDRGFIFAGLSTYYGWKKAAVLSSLIFALSHISVYNIYSFFPSFLLGFAFCYLYYISKSIVPGFIIHAFHNFIILAINYKQYISS